MVQNQLDIYTDQLFMHKTIEVHDTKIDFVRVRTNARDVWISTHKVTLQLYQKLFDKPFYTADHFHLQRPMNSIPWATALLLCNKLSQQNGLQPVYENLHGKGDLCLLAKKHYHTLTYDCNAKGFRLLADTEWSALQSRSTEEQTEQEIYLLTDMQKGGAEWGWSTTSLQQNHVISFSFDHHNMNPSIDSHTLGERSRSIGFRVVQSIIT